ncbi:MAG TPA: methyltransferase domain-containing protein [Tepidisphaeraceae bacterium]|jgi:SAM-dependent methyltransferase
MKPTPADEPAEFDEFADDYGNLVNNSIRLSGETADYFARSRVAFLRTQLERLRLPANRVLDYGCGVGLAGPLLLDGLNAQHVHGVDVSPKSITNARRRNQRREIVFDEVKAFVPTASFDLAYTSGVFHHIPPPQRPEAMKIIHDSLRPGGVVALWEHNPFNPGTRWAVYNCVFDKDAIIIKPREAVAMVREAGFEILGVRYLFIFPSFLRWFRPLEQRLSPFPVGAQYQVLGRKPTL